jgi:hypothetical protein
MPDGSWREARERKADCCKLCKEDVTCSSWVFEAEKDTWSSVYQVNDTASNHPMILSSLLSLSQAKMGFPFSSFWIPSCSLSSALNHCLKCGNDWVVGVPWSGGRSWTGLALGVRFATRLLVYHFRRVRSQSDLFVRELQKPQRQPL